MSTTVPSPGATPPTSPLTYPFGPPPGLPGVPLTYDIVIDKNYPRISFVPTEPGGIYQELVEVNGDFWVVTNATWDVNKQGFYQEVGTVIVTNPSANAYAWCNRGVAGDAIRFFGAATNNPNTAITWIATFDTAPVGTTVEPLPQTGTGQPALTVNTTFNAGLGVIQTAFQVNVTDSASSAQSALEQFCVNGVPVWLVDKTGTLQIGTVSSSQLLPPVYLQLTAGTGIAPIGPPPSATIGLAHGDYVDLPNAQTIEGAKTFDTGVQLFFGSGYGNIVGAPSDVFFLASGCEVINPGSVPFTVLAKSPTFSVIAMKQQSNTPSQMVTFYMNANAIVGNTYQPAPTAYFDNSGNFWLANNLIVNGQASITGALVLTGSLTVNGALNVEGHFNLGATAVQDLEGYFEGQQLGGFDYGTHNQAGLSIGYDTANNAVILDTTRLALIGSDPHTGPGIISSDKSVTITKTMNTGPPNTPDPGSNQTVDLSVQATVQGAFPVWRGQSGGSKVPNPTIVIMPGISIPITYDGSGPSSGGSGKVTVSFPVTFSGGYGAAATITGGGWGLTQVTGQTSGGCDVHAGVFGTSGPSSMSVDLIVCGTT